MVWKTVNTAFEDLTAAKCLACVEDEVDAVPPGMYAKLVRALLAVCEGAVVNWG